VESQRAELKAAVGARRDLEEGLARHRARELYDAAPDGVPRRIVVREERGPIERLRPLAQAVAAMPRASFVGWTADPPAIVVSASADSGVDAGAVLKSALGAVGGRGGGNARLAQGTAPSAAVMEQVVSLLSSQEP
jgi:alanyl-tRNA synthetase